MQLFSRCKELLKPQTGPKIIKVLLESSIQANELVFIGDSILALLQSSIISHEPNVFLDSTLASRVKHSSRAILNQFFVSRIYNTTQQILRPLSQSHPNRAELELSEFTRQHFVAKFDQSELPRISLPLLTFIDGFGLYRNMYRTLMGVYFIIAAFLSRERARWANVLPITLDSHGSNFADVVNALGDALQSLDAGEPLPIDRRQSCVCAFTLCYLGDMPQQNENSGSMSRNATHGCQFCFYQRSRSRRL